jgi:hypothetical protein
MIKLDPFDQAEAPHAAIYSQDAQLCERHPPGRALLHQSRLLSGIQPLFFDLNSHTVSVLYPKPGFFRVCPVFQKF